MARCAGAGVPDVRFVQEYHEPHPIQPNGPGDDVRAVAVDDSGAVWAATKAGVHRLTDGRWDRVTTITAGPTYDVHVDQAGVVWVGAWDGLYRIEGDQTEKLAAFDGPVAVVGKASSGPIALGPDGAWQSFDKAWRRIEARWSCDVRTTAFHPTHGLWIATGVGLYQVQAEASRLFCQQSELVSSAVNALAFAPDGQLWIGSTGGLDVYATGQRVRQITATNGLPHYDVRSHWLSHRMARCGVGRGWAWPDTTARPGRSGTAGDGC